MIKEEKEKKTKLRTITWNINSFRGKQQFLFPGFSMSDRLPWIQKSLDYCVDKKKVSIFCLQEVEKSVTPKLAEYFKEKNFASVVNSYNPDTMALDFITAYDPNLYTLIDQEQIYSPLNG